MKKTKTIITTPIYYPNAKLHIGHAYTTTLADVLSRFRKLENKQVFFMTGSDEHGQKLSDKAKENNQEVYDYVTDIVKNFKLLWEKLDIEYDVFIRTTDQTHKDNVQKIFQMLFDKNLIYKDYYEGFYCKSDESYFTKTQLEEGNCPICKREVSLFKEESYFLRVKDFKEWITKLLKEEDILFPQFRVNELLGSFIENDLEDLAISRKDFKWGIEIPNDENFVIYVWFDALLNYLSSFSYSSAPFGIESWNEETTEVVQFLGKEIIRFHALYWPIILKNLNYKMPKLLAHGWLIVDGEKMSKSLGNVIDPLEVIEKWGSDVLRFYLLKTVSFGSDGKFSEETLLRDYNGILVNKISNLVNRVFSMNAKYFNSKIPEATITSEETKNTNKNLILIEKKIIDVMENYDFNNYIDLVIKYSEELNGYIDLTTPWKETNEEKLKEIIWFLINKIYSLFVLIKPIMPKASFQVFEALNVQKHSFDNLFIDLKNIEIPKELILFERRK